MSWQFFGNLHFTGDLLRECKGCFQPLCFRISFHESAPELDTPADLDSPPKPTCHHSRRPGRTTRAQMAYGKGATMDVLTIVRVVAVVCIGLLAGIFLGHRTGAYYALQKLSPSSFVQFQQVVHVTVQSQFQRGTFTPPRMPSSKRWNG